MGERPRPLDVHRPQHDGMIGVGQQRGIEAHDVPAHQREDAGHFDRVAQHRHKAAGGTEENLYDLAPGEIDVAADSGQVPRLEIARLRPLEHRALYLLVLGEEGRAAHHLQAEGLGQRTLALHGEGLAGDLDVGERSLDVVGLGAVRR